MSWYFGPPMCIMMTFAIHYMYKKMKNVFLILHDVSQQSHHFSIRSKAYKLHAQYLYVYAHNTTHSILLLSLSHIIGKNVLSILGITKYKKKREYCFHFVITTWRRGKNPFCVSMWKTLVLYYTNIYLWSSILA